jgi:hypothetical protein
MVFVTKIDCIIFLKLSMSNPGVISNFAWLSLMSIKNRREYEKK